MTVRRVKFNFSVKTPGKVKEDMALENASFIVTEPFATIVFSTLNNVGRVNDSTIIAGMRRNNSLVFHLRFFKNYYD